MFSTSLYEWSKGTVLFINVTYASGVNEDINILTISPELSLHKYFTI